MTLQCSKLEKAWGYWANWSVFCLSCCVCELWIGFIPLVFRMKMLSRHLTAVHVKLVINKLFYCYIFITFAINLLECEHMKGKCHFMYMYITLGLFCTLVVLKPHLDTKIMNKQFSTVSKPAWKTTNIQVSSRWKHLNYLFDLLTARAEH